ncbi:DUF642 domain-containing protein [Phenylobacterium sp.]|uniref:DUF642 domain-containing protein n=1 Tax=Phenylobacterium sp. TaxID=1871053 RepID=UPI002D083978|nr:DUF642 domain-containing protein [Phenylobacterium sp.]HLZ73865.1 DUF642 domain-containing protein [Phenylobacterium sp.]
MKKLTLVAVVSTATLLIAAPAMASPLVVNGSFEAGTYVDRLNPHGDQGAMDLLPGSTVITGWTTTGGGDITWVTAPNGFGIAASDGAFSIDLTGYGDNPAVNLSGIQQTIATDAGATYLLTFDLGGEGQYGLPAGLLASAGAASRQFQTTTGGADSGHNGWTTETLSFVASGASTALTFTGNVGQAYIGLDNVSVVETAAPGAVPEPAAWALMIAGFGLAGAALRRRRLALP